MLEFMDRLYLRGTAFKEAPTFPEEIPKDPYKYYASDWLGWPDFLGSSNIRRKGRVIWSYEKSQRWVSQHVSHQINSIKRWDSYVAHPERFPDLPKLPDNIPHQPYIYYAKKGKWQGIKPWLEKEDIKYASYKRARQWVRGKLKKANLSCEDWKLYANGDAKYNDYPPRPVNIPKFPYHHYRMNGWISWEDFLGYKHERYLSYELAKKWVRKNLKSNVKTVTQWREYRKGNIPGLPIFPSNIPACPCNTYKDKGWKGWTSFFHG